MVKIVDGRSQTVSMYSIGLEGLALTLPIHGQSLGVPTANYGIILGDIPLYIKKSFLYNNRLYNNGRAWMYWSVQFRGFRGEGRQGRGEHPS